jgi:hypothetical protein
MHVRVHMHMPRRPHTAPTPAHLAAVLFPRNAAQDGTPVWSPGWDRPEVSVRLRSATRAENGLRTTNKT